jgi:hypothetical protein
MFILESILVLDESDFVMPIEDMGLLSRFPWGTANGAPLAFVFYAIVKAYYVFRRNA